MSREREVAEQLAQLKWRRSQNERSVRSALEATKTLKQKDTILNLTARQNFDKSYWVNSVLKDELTRPLIISDEEYVNTQSSDAAFKHRLLKCSNHQLDNIERLADTVAGRSNRHEDAVKTKVRQLEDLQVIKDKLKTRIKMIENKKAYQTYSGES
jgi:hypothetical protein